MLRLKSYREPMITALLCNFLLVAASANGWQGAPAPPAQVSQEFSQPEMRVPASVRMDCTYLGNALRATEQRVERDERFVAANPQPESPSTTGNLKAPAVNLAYDRKLLEHDRAELDKCAAWNERAKQEPTKDCSSSEFFDFHVTHDDGPAHDVELYRQPESATFFFESSLSVDADGAPNAYHPDNIGLDDITNAGAPGSWSGVAADKSGELFIQGPGDPFPGYYVSVTDLSDRAKAANDPTRYVDASRIPYIVLPEGIEAQTGARPGDFAVVFNLQNGKRSPAIFADTGPEDRIGEGSVALAESLGLWSDARSGGTTRGILYLVFSGSGNGTPRPIEEINAEVGKLFSAWGGNSQLTACGIR